MSAFVVSKGHIDRLVAVAAYGPREADRFRHDHMPQWYEPSWQRSDRQWQRLDRAHLDELNALGQMLHNENARSVAYRYREDAEDASGYEFPLSTERVTVGEALNALACYEYQACESPDWQDTEARRFCIALREAICSLLTRDVQRGWDNWERVA